MKALRASAIVLCVGAVACGSKSPSSPSTTSTLAAPTLDSPADGAAVDSYRPTFTVRNSTSAGTGGKTYEFIVSDSSGFSTTTVTTGAFVVYVHTTTVAEGSGGTTSFTPDVDLQPATKMYWRARVVSGTTASDWTATRSFTTPVGGYSRAGELFDPLAYGSTVGVPQGSTTFIQGQGLKLNTTNSYVRYQLAAPLDSGEFSMEIAGLQPGGPGGKLKVFSMMDGTGDLYRSNYLLNAQYRGVGGNPDNCIAFKALFGDPFFKLEPDINTRVKSIVGLNPATFYFWKANWSDGFQLVVQEGIGGRVIYNVSQKISDITKMTARYNPTPHYAYLGANNGPFGEEDGTWPGATYRNVWIGRAPRPATLGNALELPR